MKHKTSGILIHPTSFLGNYGCGDLGEGGRIIIDWLKKAGQSYLQILPLGPTGYGDSPYQAFSAFAGSPYIISFDRLIQKGYLSKDDLADYPPFDPARVDYDGLYKNKFRILYRAFEHFQKKKSQDQFEEFCCKNSFWLDSYALFMSLKQKNKGKSWNLWNHQFKSDESTEKHLVNNDLTAFYKFIQFEFFTQWYDFKNYAHQNGIKIIGDAPIFVSYDSADVWANQELFYLTREGEPLVVAGVPPDYFSETGQLWGNPIYRWKVMQKDDYAWWKKRIHSLLELVDCIRIDHFRGFEAYWEIPFGATTAVHGKWVKVPGYDIFNSLKKDFGDQLDDIIIAEDLGVITDEVKILRDFFNFPGMRIFEFADFPSTGTKKQEKNQSDKLYDDPYLPENYIENCIAYPGTHDNDTLIGWYQTLPADKQNDVLHYLNIKSVNELNDAVINLLLKSKANTVIFTIQDILKLGSKHRMNTPGTCSTNNWSWRLTPERLTTERAEELYQMTKESGRIK